MCKCNIVRKIAKENKMLDLNANSCLVTAKQVLVAILRIFKVRESSILRIINVREMFKATSKSVVDQNFLHILEFMFCEILPNRSFREKITYKI